MRNDCQRVLVYQSNAFTINLNWVTIFELISNLNSSIKFSKPFRIHLAYHLSILPKGSNHQPKQIVLEAHTIFYRWVCQFEFGLFQPH